MLRRAEDPKPVMAARQSQGTSSIEREHQQL
jgi:hypothetical protein